MKSTDKFVLVLVASLALLLAGCGGGSSAPDETGPTPEEIAMMAISDAKKDLEAAETAFTELPADATLEDQQAAQQAIHDAAVELLTVLEANNGSAGDIISATSARDAALGMVNSLGADIIARDNRAQEMLAIMNAKGTLTAAQTALDSAGTDAEMLAAYQAIQKAANDLITVLGANNGSAEDITAATVTRQAAASMVSSLTEKIAKAREAAAAAELAAMIKQVGTKNAAMDAEKAQTTDGGLGGSTASAIAAGNAGSYALAIKRNRMGTTVEVTVNGATDDNDVKFMSSDVSDGLTKHVRTHEADDDGNVMEETAMVMTDIAAPKATPFAMVTGQILNTRDLDTSRDGPDNDGDLTNDFTALTVVTANVGNVMSTAFPTTRSGTLNFDGDTASSTDIDEAEEVRGTYNGAMGTYRCIGAGVDSCTVVIGDTDAATSGVQLGITNMTSWVFTPDPGATSDVPDSMYHHYGFWIKKTTDSDGVITYDEVQTFTGVEEMAVHPSAVSGTAKYTGGALGVYTHKVLDPEGETTAVSGGHFTADANLMAYFGGDDVAVNKQNTVTGTIDKFMLAGGESNNWSVSLEGTTSAGVVTGTDWSASFYGADANGDDTVDDATATPAAILGEFNAAFANGQVAGAFGADLEE